MTLNPDPDQEAYPVPEELAEEFEQIVAISELPSLWPNEPPNDYPYELYKKEEARLESLRQVKGSALVLRARAMLYVLDARAREVRRLEPEHESFFLNLDNPWAKALAKETSGFNLLLHFAKKKHTPDLQLITELLDLMVIHNAVEFVDEFGGGRGQPKPIIDYGLTVAELALAYARDHELPSDWKPALHKIWDYYGGRNAVGKSRALINQIDELLHDRLEWPMRPRDRWADEALSDVESFGREEAQAWLEFLRHASTAKTRPAKKWKHTTAKLIEPLGAEAFARWAGRWLGFIGEAGPDERNVGDTNKLDATVLKQVNEQIAAGLVWGSAHVPAMQDTVVHAIEKGLEKLAPGEYRSPLLAEVGLRVLAEMEDGAGLETLASLGPGLPLAKYRKLAEKLISESVAAS
ncbi:MAG: hypothetical protein AAGA25_08680 [Planctomycetota bacterium]